MPNDYTRAAEAIRNANRVIASTGAGASTESGIPDFRSAGGIWDTYPPEEYATIDAFLANPAKVWNLWRTLGAQFSDAKPNPGHVALAELENTGHLNAIITQNVDNLHQEAGNTAVIEYHGNSSRTVCMSCKRTQPLSAHPDVRGTPFCVCGGILKPDVIMFGEMIPQKAMLQSEALARTADCVIIVGTSAQVFPAAQLPVTAKEHGAFIIEANLEETDFTRTITDVFLQGPCGETLPQLTDAVLAAK